MRFPCSLGHYHIVESNSLILRPIWVVTHFYVVIFNVRGIVSVSAYLSGSEDADI